VAGALPPAAAVPLSQSLIVLPRDAMLTRYVLSSYVCPSVRPPVRHKPALYQSG